MLKNITDNIDTTTGIMLGTLVVTMLCICSCCGLWLLTGADMPTFGAADNRTSVPDGNQGVPTVTISQPAPNTAFQVGQTVTVQAQASDPGGSGITRVELRVNNVIVDSQTSAAPGGEQTLSVLLDYVAAVPNPALTLTVRAYRGTTPSQDAVVTVVVNQRSGAATPTTASGSTPFTGNTAIPPTTNPLCRARVDVDSLNVRSGPGTTYDILYAITLSQEYTILGKSSDGTWWQINGNGRSGWISAAYSTALGNCGSIPVIAGPASPTPNATQIPTPVPNTNPNLVITTLAGNTSIVLIGEQVIASYIVRVKNVGGTTTGAFNVTFFFPNGTTYDHAIASLAPGVEVTIDGINAQFSAPGSYRLQVQVDSSGNITELSEDDNRAYLDIVVVDPTPTPEGQ